MREDHDPAYIDQLLRKRWIIAGERSQEGARDNGIHSHHAGELLGSSAGLLSLSISTQSGNWVVPATHCFWLPPREVHAVRSFGPFSGWGVFVAEMACTDLPGSARTMRTGALRREAVRRLASLPLVETSSRREYLGGVIVDEIDDLPPEELGLAMPSDPRLLRIAQALAGDPAVDRILAAWAISGQSGQALMALASTRLAGSRSRRVSRTLDLSFTDGLNPAPRLEAREQGFWWHAGVTQLGQKPAFSSLFVHTSANVSH